MTEDLAAYLADFGQIAVINGTQVRAIYDAAYALATLGNVGASATDPSLLVRTADVPAAPVGKVVTVAGLSFRIAEHQPDGTGMSLLVLERTA